MRRTVIKSFDDISAQDIQYITNHVRPGDLSEFGVLGLDVGGAAYRAFHASEDAYLALHDGKPTFVWGTIKAYDHMRALWGVGTSSTWRAMPEISFFGQTFWIPALFEQHGVKRVEVRLPSASRTNRGWLEKMGLRTECEMTEYGLRGEPFVQMAYTTKEYADKCARQARPT